MTVGIRLKTLNNFELILMNKIQLHRSNFLLFFTIYSSETINIDCKIVLLHIDDENKKKWEKKMVRFIEKGKKMN